MSDFLVEFAKNKLAQRAVKTLGLPVPMPRELQRASQADADAQLADAQVVIGGAGPLVDVAKAALTSAGASVADECPEEDKINALVFDASGLESPAALRNLYLFFHSRVRSLKAHGRVVVLGRPPEGLSDPLAATSQRALLGFVKSLGKELGRKAITANLLWVAEDAGERLAGPLTYLLSKRAAFVSGQGLTIAKRARGGATNPQARPLTGKVALVTGAARGIGEAIARRLGQEGATLVLVDRPEGMAGLDGILSDFPGTQCAVDLLEPHALEAILKHVEAHHGKLDILVNNAGITRDRTLAKMSEQWWDMCLEVNLEVACALTAAVTAGPMASQGRVVHISSIGGIAGNPGQTNYAASKAGLIGHAEALAGSLARRGITINCVAPGFIETAMTAAMPAGPREAGRRLNAMSQGGLPSDIADAVTFLASPSSQGVSGQVLRVCGLHVAGA